MFGTVARWSAPLLALVAALAAGYSAFESREVARATTVAWDDVRANAYAASVYMRTLSLAACRTGQCRHEEVRSFAIRSQIEQAEGPRYIVIGDSITEAAALRPVCGRAPINAGIGGATVLTFDRLGAELVRMARPDAVVIALGTNDSFKPGGADLFEAGYRRLIQSLAAGRLALVPIPPVVPVGVGAQHPGNGNIADYNAKIAAVAKEVEAVLAAPLERTETTDGIHLTASDYREWRESLEAAVSAALGC